MVIPLKAVHVTDIKLVLFIFISPFLFDKAPSICHLWENKKILWTLICYIMFIFWLKIFYLYFGPFKTE